MRLWVIAYDIVDNRRRRLVADFLGRHANRVQESVFEGMLTGQEIQQVTKTLGELMEKGEDSLRCYPIGVEDPNRRRALGTQPGMACTQDYWVI